MTAPVADLLRELRARDVRLEIDHEDRLVFDAPRGAVTVVLRALIRRHRRELVEMLAPGPIPWRVDALAACERPETLPPGSVVLPPQGEGRRGR